MTLTLRAVSLNDQPLTQPITARFDAQGGSIGRADHNVMALPDPERHISRQQAQIIVAEGRYRIKNIGSANPIMVRGQSLAQGESAALTHRDQVRIGGYLLEVSEERDDDETAYTQLRSRAAHDARQAAGAALDADTPATPATPAGARGRPVSPAAVSAAPAVEPGARLSSSNPFADLLAPQPSAAQRSTNDDAFADLLPPAAGLRASSAAFAPPAAAAPRLPDDFDPFAPPVPAVMQRPMPVPSRPAGAFGDLIPGAAEGSIDEMFALGPSAGDALGRFMDGAAPARPNAPGGAVVDSLPKDPMLLFGDATPPPSNPVVPTLPDHTPALRAAFTPPAVVSPREPAAAAPTPTSATADAQALWRAFCDGAGVRLAALPGPSADAMRVVGEMLRAAIDGSLQLMAVRAATKHEMRAAVTVIQPRNNNPLKFSPDAQSALEQLLQPPLRGFLAGPAAVTDAMHDLVGHSIGTMAGMRAALEGVLDRFSPQSLEAKLNNKTMLDSLLPMNHKAKLWELYLQHAEAIRHDAQDDFETLFGKAFLSAYQQQLDRLDPASSP